MAENGTTAAPDAGLALAGELEATPFEAALEEADPLLQAPAKTATPTRAGPIAIR